MDRALELGRRGWGRVHPNPMVGCLIVRDGDVVGEGWHREYGGPHAEVDALAAAGEAARGATAYVSLEPCCHTGKTPPCTRALMEAGVARVVFGAADTGRDSGGGGRELGAAGLDVTGPLLSEAEARRENPAFFHPDGSRPWVDLKLALSLDGKIAARPGERTSLSGPDAGAEVQRLRAGFDAILVGANTALVDDPLLTVRGSVKPRTPPVRVVLDGRGRLGPGARMLREGVAPVWIVTGAGAPEGWKADLAGAGARLVEAPTAPDGRIDLPAALSHLRGEGIRALLCEGGGILASALLDGGLVDRLDLIFSPRFLGEQGVPAFPGLGAAPLPGELDRPGEEGEWRVHPEVRRLGPDLWITLDREA
jgi:diaminohydroxyphosphoribosylaminopyrimidine deaminase / 5-amino-6-(5-phosphoribosylamino)uracil reductase